MSFGRSRTLVSATLLLLALGPGAGVSSRAQEAGQGFKSSTTAVMVDVVVRDSKGAPVVDLTPADFELFEDNVPMQIGSVSLVAPGRSALAPARAADGAAALPATTASATGTAAAPSGSGGDGAVAQPTVLALVFHRLSPEARALARRAALAYLDSPARADDFAGVFQVDQSLDTIQTYTRDRDKVRQAIDIVSSRPASGYARQTTSGSGSAGGDRDPGVSPTAGAESPGRPPGDAGFTPRTASSNSDRDPELLVTLMRERMEQSYEAMMRQQQGDATINGLIALFDSMRALPGRKSVVLFAEGLSIPADVLPRFQELVGIANRANVSVYTMDAAGLRVQSEQAATARAVAKIGFAATGDVVKGDPDEESSAAMTRRLERNELILRQDPHVALSLLAKATGGFLIDGTNNLADAFGRIDSDRRFHYLLTYAPINTAQDGTYRHILVKVRRRNVDVRARDGYYASATPGVMPAFRFEAEAVAALARVPRPTQIPVRAGLFQFPDPARPGRLVLLVSVPEGELGHMVDASKTSYRTDFLILARLTDAGGVVVRQGSLPYQLTGPADEVEKARGREVLFYRQPTVAPGSYTLEYVVHDALTGHDGTGIAPVTIETPAAGAPIVSSLVIVRRAEQVPAAERDPKNPLYCGDLLLYPNLGEPLRKSTDQALTFFYSVYPPASAQPLAATLTLDSVGGQTLANVPLTLPSADDTGRIQHLARLPLANVPAGAYTLRISVTSGTMMVTRSTSFTLVP